MSTVSHLRSLKLKGCLCHSSLSGVTPDAVIVERKHGLRGFTAGRAGRFPFPTFQVCCPHHWSLLPGWSHVKTRKGYVLGVFAPLRACAYPETMYSAITLTRKLGLYLQGGLTQAPHLRLQLHFVKIVSV